MVTYTFRSLMRINDLSSYNGKVIELVLEFDLGAEPAMFKGQARFNVPAKTLKGLGFKVGKKLNEPENRLRIVGRILDLSGLSGEIRVEGL